MSAGIEQPAPQINAHSTIENAYSSFGSVSVEFAPSGGGLADGLQWTSVKRSDILCLRCAGSRLRTEITFLTATGIIKCVSVPRDVAEHCVPPTR
jgi:hypothetical protein